MKKLVTLFILVIVFFVLDNVLIPFFAIRTIYPSLLMVFVICYSMVNGTWEGIWIGAFSGLLQDIYFTNGIGINALVNMTVCIVAGIIGNNIFKEKRLIPVISCFFLSLMKGILLLLILYINGIYINITDIFFIAIYNMFVCLLIYKKVFKLCEKDYMQKRWKF